MKVNYRVTSGIREPVPDTFIPLRDIAVSAGAAIQQRVHEHGLAGDGSPWSGYKSRPGRWWFWAPAGAPQPDSPERMRGHPVKTGPRTGQSAYRTYLGYLRARGIAPPGGKHFVLTGELMQSIEAVMQSGIVAYVQYNNQRRKSLYGRAKSGAAFTNQKVAQFAFRLERMSPMQLSPAELADVAKAVEDGFTSTMLRQEQLEDLGFQAQRRATSLERRARRLLRGAQ